MRYGAIKKTDIANGEGVRVSLFVSGCRHHCKGCFNSETWDFNYGEDFTIETLREIYDALDKPYISGLTILGGEPLDPRNVRPVTAIVNGVRRLFPDKTIWIYTGYKYEDVKDLEIMGYIDVLVDGRFIESQKDISLQFRGSRNQRIIDIQRTERFNSIQLWRSNND